MKTNYRLKGNQKLYISPISDLHRGSPEFNQSFLDYYLDTFDNIQSDKRMYILGDALEAANKQTGNASFNSNLSLDEQIEDTIDTFKPYRKWIGKILPGNHCDRLKKDYNLEPLKIVAKALGVPYGRTIHETIYINQQPFTIFGKHGKGSASQQHLQQGKAIRETTHIDADLFMEGHSHRSDFFSVPCKSLHSETGIHRKYYCFTGAFLSYKGSYAEDMYLPPLPESFQMLSINKDMIVRNTAHHIDVVRPDLLVV